MIEQTDEFFAPAVIDAIFTKGFDLTVGGKSFKEAGPVRRDYGATGDIDHRVEFHAHFHLGDHAVKMAISFKRQDPVADVWAWLIYGTTATSAPMIERKRVRVSNNKEVVTELDDSDAGFVLHGQATVPAHFTHNFATDSVKLSHMPLNYTPTALVPHDPNGTGEQGYMGRHHDFASVEQARELCYSIGGYGGVFVRGDFNTEAGIADDAMTTWAIGDFVSESHYPDLQLFPGSHFPRAYRYPKDHWIDYTHWREPWRNKATMRTANREHYTVYRPVALALQQFPHDIGLRWLNIANANRYLLEMPGKPKRDPYLFPPTSSRGRGRPMLVATGLFRGLLACGETDLAMKVGKRALDRFEIQKQDWISDIQFEHTWIPEFNVGPWTPMPKHSPRQLGLWWHGLDELDDVLAEHDEAIPELDYMKAEIAAQVFRWFGIDGKGIPQLPYWAHLDGSHPPQHEAGGEHFAATAALDHQPSDAAEERKYEAIEAWSKTVDPKWMDR